MGGVGEKEKGWQKSVVNYGNYAFRRIPYEEWGLKSVPPLSKRRKSDEVQGKSQVEVVYPKSLLPMEKVPGILQKLSTERESLHRRKMMWCFIAMPFTIPVAVIPMCVPPAPRRKAWLSPLPPGNMLMAAAEYPTSLFLPRLPCLVALESAQRGQSHSIPFEA